MIFISKPNPFGGGFQVPDRIIIHAMAEYINYKGKIYHAADWLEYLKLSAHFLIPPKDEIIKTRNIDRVAYHAKGHNLNTIGIEFLVEGVHDYSSFLKAIDGDYMTERAWGYGVELVQELNIKEIVRHSDVDPKRKKDPGNGFNFELFKAMI